MLDERRLRVFAAVAKAGSIMGAAECLLLTPPAVSQQIAALERQVNRALFERGPRGVSLTEAGQVLLDACGDVLDRLDVVEATMRTLGSAEVGPLRVAAFQSAGESLVPPAFAMIRDGHPGVRLAYHDAEPVDAIAALKSGEVDMAIVHEVNYRAALIDTTLVSELIAEDPLFVILPRKHPFAERDSVALADLAGENWIMESAESSCSRATEQTCRSVGFEARGHIRTDDYPTTCGFVAAGFGVALVPALALTNPPPGICGRPISDVRAIRRLFAVHRPPSERPPLLADALAALRDTADDAIALAQGRLGITGRPVVLV
jgi:DNA-binding transcriptional LysR family regulator